MHAKAVFYRVEDEDAILVQSFDPRPDGSRARRDDKAVEWKRL